MWLCMFGRGGYKVEFSRHVCAYVVSCKMSMCVNARGSLC